MNQGDKNKNNVTLPVVNPSPVPSNGRTNPSNNSKLNEHAKADKNSLPSLGAFKFETKHTNIYQRGIIGKGRDFFQLKQNSHVEYSKNEDAIHNYFLKYLNQKKNYLMPSYPGEIIMNSQGAIVWTSGGESLVNKKDQDEQDQAIKKPLQKLASNLQKLGTTEKKKFSDEIEYNIKQVNQVGRSIDLEFQDAASIQKSGRTTLYSTIINTNENLIRIAESSIGESPNTSMIHQSRFDGQTVVDHTQRSYNSHIRVIKREFAPVNSSYLLEKYYNKFDSNIAKDFASGLYIPKTQRLLKFDNRTKKQRKLNPLASDILQSNSQNQNDQNLSKRQLIKKEIEQPFATTKEIIEQIKITSPEKQQINETSKIDVLNSQSQIIFHDDQQKQEEQEENKIIAITDRHENLQNALHLHLHFLEQEDQKSHQENKQRIRKQQSFSLEQTRFGDAREAVDKHPLKYAKLKGPILIDLETIYKMKKAKRYPIPEKLLHKDSSFQLQIDSIMRQAYDEDEIQISSVTKQEIDAPCNSMQSNEKIEFYSSFSDDDDLNQENDDEIKFKSTAKGKKIANESDIIKIVKKRKQGGFQKELPPDTKEARAYEDKMESLKIHKDALTMHGFDMELLKGYPQNHIEGDIPSFLISNEKRLAGLSEIHQPIKEEFNNKVLLPTNDHIQLIFELFCKEFDCQPFTILKYFHNEILSYSNYFLSMKQVKAVCCTLPLIPKLKKIQFCNNHLTDEMSTLIIMSAFMNPVLCEISIQQNQLKRSAMNTLKQLLQYQSNKLLELDISGSKEISNNLETLIYNMGSNKALKDSNGNRLGYRLRNLDLSNIQLSSSACLHIGNILINTQNIKQINLQNCQINGLGTRYIIDSLNQNIGLQFFDFSHNNLSSNVYENSIKIAKIISRHQEIMHIDITNTCLLREEVIFIGMALPISRSCIGLHMSGNGLEYYDRVFLRTLIDAKVNFHFKNIAQQKMNNINKNLRKSEKNHYNQLEHNENQDGEFSEFIRAYNYIERQKLVLNENLTQVLQDVDIIQMFRNIRKGKVKNSNADAISKSQQSQQKLVELINKINERQRLIDNQQKEILRFSDKDINLNDDLVIKNLTTMGLYKKINKSDNDTQQIEIIDQEQKIININDKQDLKEDIWLMQNALKIDRIRQRVQLDALKHLKAKSSAEIALMFIGINKIAYDILMDNPMTAYMSQVVFTRILGNDDVEESETWRDCTQCWVCEKWSKNRIDFKHEYVENMRQRIDHLHELHDVLEKCLDKQNYHMLKKVGKDLNLNPNNNRYNNQSKGFQDENQESDKTLSIDRLDTQSIQSEAEQVNDKQELVFNGDLINPIKFDRAKAMKLLPENLKDVKSIHRISPKNLLEITESSDDDLISQPDQRQKFSNITPMQQTKSTFNYPKQFSNKHPQFQQAKKLQQNTFQMSLKQKVFKEQDYNNKYMQKSLQFNETIQNPDESQKKLSYSKIQQLESEKIKKKKQKLQEQIRKRGKSQKYQKSDGHFYRLQQKKVYFQGIYHLVDYEQKVDSEDNSSAVDTSEDEFNIDHHLLQNQFQLAIQRKINRQNLDQESIQQVLNQYKPKEFNIFGGKQIFLCASFNDWVPVEMKSIQEIKLEKKHGDNLLEYLKKTQDNLESQKEQNNIKQFSSFVPPGRHFFYFIYNKSQIILSNDHQIVRFGESSVFLNEISIQQRPDFPKKISLLQKRSNQDGKVFKKERSVFKTYQEDDADFVHRMLKQDLKYSKIERLCQRSEKAERVIEILEKYYSKLKSIYNFYIANSTNYPRMNAKDFTQICYRCKIFDRNLNLVSMERNLVTTNASINPYKNSDDKELNRYEFFEILVRTAKSKYQDPKIFQSLNDALEIFLTKDFMPHCKFLDGVKFRAQYVFNQQVDEIFKKNQIVLRQLFQYCSKLIPTLEEEQEGENEKQNIIQITNEKLKDIQQRKKVEKNSSSCTKQSSTTTDINTSSVSNNQIQISLVNVRELCLQANINMKVQKINQNYVESLMSRIDTMKDPILATNMRFSEFLLFIAKVAYDIYQDSKQEEEINLAQKIDVVLEPLLATAGLQKKFSFYNQDQQSSSDEKEIDSTND